MKTAGMPWASLPALAPLFALVVSAAPPAQSPPRFSQIDNELLPPDAHGVLSIASGDVDGDGDADLALGRRDRDMLLLNQGGGRFADGSGRLPPSVPDAWSTTVLGDVDGDGDLDLLLGVNRGKDLLLRNDGSGNFTDDTAGNLDIDGGATTTMALDDLDGDGDPDLMVGGQWSASNFVATNDGTGTFTLANQPLPSSTREVLPRDVDGDGDLDLLVLASGRMFLLDNDGSGNLTDVTASRLPAAGSTLLEAAAADVDRDGDEDLVLGRATGGNLLYLNNGNGTFRDATAGRMPAIPDRPVRLLLVDLDGDNAPELIHGSNPVAGQGGQDRILTNDGAGTFTPANAALGFRDPGIDIYDLHAEDVDGDGDRDVLAGGFPATLRLLLNDGSARLTPVNEPFLARDADDSRALAAGDLDGDGDIDVVMGAHPVKVLVNDGRGRFRQEGGPRFPRITHLVEALLLADVDGDNDLDLLVDSHRLFLNDGSGFFSDVSASHLPAGTGSTLDLEAVDVDGDGDLDLVLAKEQARNLLFLNDGTGSFTDVTATHMPPDADNSRAIDSGDVDGDGDPDLVVGNMPVANTTAGRDRLYLNDGTGRFQRTFTNLPAHSEPTGDIRLADLDGDGDLDVTKGTASMANFPGRDRLYFNDGAGRFTDVSISHLPLMGNLTLGLGIADVDEDGDLDILHANSRNIGSIMASTGTLQNILLINDGQGRFRDRTSVWLPAVEDETHAVGLHDVDGDRDPDLLLANQFGAGSVEADSNRLYFNLGQHLVGPDIARIGTTRSLEIVMRSTTSNVRMALPGSSLGAARLPSPPFGVLGLDPTRTVLWPFQQIPAGAASTTFRYAVPADPGLLGRTLHDQVLLIDPFRSFDTWRLTNPVSQRLH